MNVDYALLTDLYQITMAQGLSLIHILPASKRRGVAKSMRLAVVGPTEPKGRPAAAGVGPA